LSDTEKIRRVALASKQADAVKESPITLRQALRKSIKKTKKKPAVPDTGILIEIHPSDQKLWDELRSIADQADEIVSGAEVDTIKQKRKKGPSLRSKSG